MARQPRMFQGVEIPEINATTQEMSSRMGQLIDRAFAGGNNLKALDGPQNNNVSANNINWGNEQQKNAVANYLEYANEGATRNQPLSQNLAQALSFLGELGITGRVYSGGQPKIGTSDARVGSVRHDDGNAADMLFFKDGRQLDWSNPNDLPYFQEIVRRGKAAGLTGFGAGPGYMQAGSMHVGFGKPAVWGAGGKGANAPDWLKQSYYG